MALHSSRNNVSSVLSAVAILIATTANRNLFLRHQKGQKSALITVKQDLKHYVASEDR